MDFITEESLTSGTWGAFERAIFRELICEGYQNVRRVGGTNDKGADIIGSKFGKRWIFQAKRWKKPVGMDVVKETIDALKVYDAQIPVIVSVSGFDKTVYEQREAIVRSGFKIQLWDKKILIERFSRLPDPVQSKTIRDYQEVAISKIVESYYDESERRALIVLATGLGKTFVSSEAIRRINAVEKRKRTLVLAHTNPLVEQLERSFWPSLDKSQSTVIWNGNEHPDPILLSQSDFVFACIDTVEEAMKRGTVYDFDIIMIDECHHAGSSSYQRILDYYLHGAETPMLIGLTATPWRADEIDITEYFGLPKIQIDMIYGMNHGFLSNVDYRMHTDNINWESLKDLNGECFSPSQINRKFFINQWDDAVVDELQRVWHEQTNPRAIVFCGTIDHTEEMKRRINALSFCRAETIGSNQPNYQKNKTLCDFADGKFGVICTVDIFNEGLDVPDVNILVFQRVTHSRRIFIQQLGRGLRIAEGKDKVIVLDFVSDIRRFAAGLNLKTNIENKGSRLDIHNKVTFRRVGGDDPQAESFLKQWLNDVAEIENADEDASVLKYPPKLE